MERIDTSRQVEYVGVYISDKVFVDRNTGYATPNAQRERTFSQVQAQVTNKQPISINVPLPANVYSTNSPGPSRVRLRADRDQDGGRG